MCYAEVIHLFTGVERAITHLVTGIMTMTAVLHNVAGNDSHVSQTSFLPSFLELYSLTDYIFFLTSVLTFVNLANSFET